MSRSRPIEFLFSLEYIEAGSRLKIAIEKGANRKNNGGNGEQPEEGASGINEGKGRFHFLTIGEKEEKGK